MNRPALFLLVCAFVLVVSNNSYSQSVPTGDLSPNTISMPWKTFYSLWSRAKDPEIKRGKKYAFGKSTYIGNADVRDDDYFIRFNSTHYIQTFGSGEKLVPILSNQINLESIQVDSQPSTWAEKDGFFHVVLSEENEHVVTASFTVKISAKEWPRRLNLMMVPMAQSEIVLHVPDKNVEALFTPGVTLDTLATAKGSQIRGFIPAVGEFSLKWLKQTQDKQDVALKTDATVYTLASLEEEGATSQTQVTYRILQGKANHFKIQIPAAVDILDVAGVSPENPVSQWYTEDGENHKIIHIYSSYQQSDRMQIKIDYEKSAKGSSYDYAVPTLIPLEVERFESYYAIGSKTHVQISEAKTEQTQKMDVRFLPEDFPFVKNDAIFFYKTLNAEAKLLFKVQSHEKVALVKTRIDLVESSSVLTESGTLMTKITYHVKNNQAQFLRLELPKKAKLLSAFLSGQEIQPGLDEQKYLLIPIIKSANTSFPVEIAYLAQINPLTVLGHYTILLPKSELPIGELNWSLHVPQTYQIVHFGGNVQERNAGIFTPEFWSRAFMGTSRLAWAGMDSSVYQYNTEGLKQRFKKKDLEMAEEETSNNQIQVQIPVSGREYRFSSYLISGFTPQISFFYINEWMQKSVSLIAGVILFVFAFWTLALLFEKFHIPRKFAKTKKYFKALALLLLAGIFLVYFSFGISTSMIQATALATAFFAVWQNRKVSYRFHMQIKGKIRYLTEFFLLMLVMPLVALYTADFFGAMAFYALCSVLFHALFNKLVPKMRDRINNPKKPRTSTSPAVFLLMLGTSLCSMALAKPALALEIPIPPSIAETEDGQVFLNWDVVEDILKKIEQNEGKQVDQLGIGYTFGNATVTGEIFKKYVELKINVPLKILADHFVQVPLFTEDATITEALLDGLPLSLNAKDNQIFFETIKSSDQLQTLQLDVIVPIREKGGVDEFVIQSPLLKGANIELNYDKEIQSITLRDVVWQKTEGNKIFAALGKRDLLDCELATFNRKKDAVDDLSKRAKKIYAETFTLVSLEESVGTLYSSIRYKVLNDEVREFSIRLPDNVIVHDIIGRDLEEWKATGSKDGLTTYAIRVLYPITDQYDLSVQYEKPLEKKTEFSVPNLLVDGVARNVGFMGVETRTQAEVLLKDIQKARMIDIKELPAIIRSDASSPLIYAIRYLEQPYILDFKIKEREPMALDPAVADYIKYTHVISPEGKVLVQAQMTVRNSQKQFVTMELPKGAQLMSAFLDGESIKPSQGEEGKILLPLKRQSNQPFNVEVIYEDAGASVNPLLGKTTLAFPKLDIQASRIDSEVYAPRNYHFSNPYGDFKSIGLTGFVPWYESRGGYEEIYDSGSLQDRPTGGIEDDFKAMPSDMGDPSPPAPVVEIQSQLLKVDETNMGGTLPLRIDIPMKGKIIAANTFFVSPEKTLVVKFCYANFFLYYFFFAAIVLLVFWVGYGIPSYAKKTLPVKLIIPLAVLAVLIFSSLTWQVILLDMVCGFGLSLLVNFYQKKKILTA